MLIIAIYWQLLMKKVFLKLKVIVTLIQIKYKYKYKLLLIPTIMEQIYERKFTLHFITLHSQLIPKVIYPKTSQTSYQAAVLTWINSVEIAILALY